MKNCIITFRSITPAQQAEGVLQRAGVGCSLQRTPMWKEEKGCGYSVRLDCGNAMAATMLLQQAGINFRKVYSFGDNNTPEELPL